MLNCWVVWLLLLCWQDENDSEYVSDFWIEVEDWDVVVWDDEVDKVLCDIMAAEDWDCWYEAAKFVEDSWIWDSCCWCTLEDMAAFLPGDSVFICLAFSLESLFSSSFSSSPMILIWSVWISSSLDVLAWRDSLLGTVKLYEPVTKLSENWKIFSSIFTIKNFNTSMPAQCLSIVVRFHTKT